MQPWAQTPDYVPLDQPVVLVDCDGPLADFTTYALELVFQETGKQWQPEDIKTWEIFETINDKSLEDRVYAKLKGRGGCSSLAVVEGALEGIKRLQGISEVVIVTAPFSGSETWVHERENWLYKHFGIPAVDIIHAKKKYHVAGDFLVDDRPKHIRSWAARWKSGHALLWDTPGNRTAADQSLERVHSWAEVFDRVSALRQTRVVT